MMPALARLTVALFLAATGSALAQDPGTVEDKTLPPLEHPGSSTPARELFGRKTTPDPATPRSIGFYSRGCLAGAVALPINGATWQVMRLSRNRNWGHPKLVAFLERLADKAKKVGWNGLLVGDMSQPRGGPMLTGHTSHQVGLDADIWLTPMPDRKLSREEREFMSATMAVRDDRRDVDPNVWTHAHTELIRVAAEDPAVERIFVNAAIKKALCREAGSDRSLARQGAAVARARLSFPHPDILSAGQSAMRSAAAAGVGRRMRSRSRSVVHGRNVASAAAVHRAGEAGAGAYAGEIAAGLPPSSDGAVTPSARWARPQRQSTVRPNSACCTAANISVSAAAQPTITAVKAGTFVRGVSISRGRPFHKR